MENKARSNILITLKGFIIGVANIIPGVSGGTLALVLGIYERMINSIKNFSFYTLACIFKALSFRRKHIDAFKKEMKKVDMLFLLLLLLGIALAFVAFSKLVTALLESHHEITYGFFFGLILASIALPFSIIKRKNIFVFISIAVGIAAVVLLTISVPDSERIKMAAAEPESGSGGLDMVRIVMVLVTGVLSTSAMILPGISGSFISLLLGQYFFLLQAVSTGNLLVLGLYAAGAVVGLKLIAKAMDYLFRHYHDILMAFLTGLVIGSLFVTWPFKTVYVTRGETLYLSNKLPQTFAANEWLTLAAAVFGILIVVIVIILNKTFANRNREKLQTPESE